MAAAYFVNVYTAVITGDVVNSRSLTSDQLDALMGDIRAIATTKRGFVDKPGEDLPSYIPYDPDWNPVFRGDSLQFICLEPSALEAAIMLRLFCRSYFSIRNGKDRVTSDVRLSIGVGPDKEAQQSYAEKFIISGEALESKTAARLSIQSVDKTQDEELAVLASLVDALINTSRAIQARNLMYAINYRSISKAARALGITPAAVSRSVSGYYEPLIKAIQRFESLSFKSKLY